MKKLLLSLSLVIAIGSFLSSTVIAQLRSAGQMVVPYGWENRDSIRFSLWGDFFWGPWNRSPVSGWIVNLQMDSVLDNSVGDFGAVQKNFTPVGLRAHGAVDAQTGTVLDGLQSIRQRVYYAQQNPEFPASLPYGGYDHIYRWRLQGYHCVSSQQFVYRRWKQQFHPGPILRDCWG
jgi:hypothetical protein